MKTFTFKLPIKRTRRVIIYRRWQITIRKMFKTANIRSAKHPNKKMLQILSIGIWKIMRWTQFNRILWTLIALIRINWMMALRIKIMKNRLRMIMSKMPIFRLTTLCKVKYIPSSQKMHQTVLRQLMRQKRQVLLRQ